MMNFSALHWTKGRSRIEAARGRPYAQERAAVPDAAQLHALYLDGVYCYVTRRVERREDAEDVCAEVFACAFEQLPTFRGDVEVRLWLLGIARRKVADALRKRVRRREIEWTPELEPPETSRNALPQHALASEESRTVLRSVLLGLKEEQREVLLLKYVEELSIEEIAVVIGRSKAATNSLLQRARATAFKAGASYFLDFQSPAPTETIRGEQ